MMGQDMLEVTRFTIEDMLEMTRFELCSVARNVGVPESEVSKFEHSKLRNQHLVRPYCGALFHFGM